ncbi:DUF3152 domain-containing protein [Dermatophilaceae bacterium Soc4.6]
MSGIQSEPRPAPGRSGAGRRAAMVRRQQVRRRRSALLAVGVLLVGTVLARALESPTDVTALTADRLGGQQPGSHWGRPGRSGGCARTRVHPSDGADHRSRPRSDRQCGPVTDDGSDTPAPDTTRLSVPNAGTGRLGTLAIPSGPVASTVRTVRYSVEVEGGLPVSSPEFARTVMTVLTDRRGWQTEDGVRLVPVSPQQLASGVAVDVRVTLASPSPTARLCAPLNVTIQQVSCWNGSRSVLNLTRWMHGSETFGRDLADYRTYLISHEVGHGLGHGHVSCPARGRPAPVMVQQTKSLEGCTASPWPTGA